MNEENYYQILEVDINASDEIIDKAYRTLVKKYHPDLQNENNKSIAEEKIKKINTAYDILSNAEKRKAYDEILKNNTISEEQYNILVTENMQLKRQLDDLKNRLSTIANYYDTIQKNNTTYNNFNNNINNYASNNNANNSTVNYNKTNFVNTTYNQRKSNNYIKKDNWFKGILKKLFKIFIVLFIIFIIMQVLAQANILNSDAKILVIIILMVIFFSSLR